MGLFRWVDCRAVSGWEKAGMMNDSVVVFTTDNGGPQPTHNNYPLRGGKFTNCKRASESERQTQRDTDRERQIKFFPDL